MKINDFLVENKVEEAPQGMISRGLNKLGAKFLPGKWGAQAQGRVEAGTLANKLYKDYFKYLGSSGQQPSLDSIQRFLQTQKIHSDVVGPVAKQLPPTNPAKMSTKEVEKFLMGVSQNVMAGEPTVAASPQAAPAQSISQPVAASPQAAPAPAAAANTPPQKTAAAGNTPVTPTTVANPPVTKKARAPRVKPGFKINVKDLKQPNTTQTPLPASPEPTTATPPNPVTNTPVTKKARAPRVKKIKTPAATATPAPMNTRGKATGNFAQMPTFESMLKAISEAAYTGKPMSRKAYFFAIKMLEHQNVTLKDLGIRVLIRESSVSHIVLKKN